jgi:hypothetical protein
VVVLRQIAGGTQPVSAEQDRREGADTTTPLGPLVAKERGDLTLTLLLLIVGVPAFLIALPGVFLQNPIASAVCLTGLVASLAGMYLLPANWYHITAFHEHGIRRGPPGREATYLYQDVVDMAYNIRRLERGGIQFGRCYLRLRTGPAGGKLLRLTVTYKDKPGLTTSRDVERILSMIADYIADHMAEQIARGASVPWTDRMRLNAQGIELRNPAGAYELIQWSRISQLDRDDESLRLWVDGEPQVKVQAAMDEPNSLPGYRFTESKMRDLSTGRQPREAAALKSLATELAGGQSAGEFTVRFTFALEDQLALLSYTFWEHRWKGWSRRVFFSQRLTPLLFTFLLMVMAVGSMSGSMSAWAWVIVLGGSIGACAFILALPYLLHLYAKYRLRHSWQAAARFAQEGKGESPAFPLEITLAAPGCRTKTPNGESHYLWGQFTMIDWYAGRIFLILPSKRKGQLTFVLLPDRAFPTKDQARETFEKIQEWRRAAV